MKEFRICFVAGARPNFMKVAPIMRAFDDLASAANDKGIQINTVLVHTGQHYDGKMSEIFFEDLGIRKPDYNLGVGSGSHAVQTGRVMIEFEKVLEAEKPNLVVVVGDVNSTVACSLTAVKMGIWVAHIEAGLRSFDRSMPEEINRVITDSISDFLFVTEESGLENLRNEGIQDERIFFTGNVMIDTLMANLKRMQTEGYQPKEKRIQHLIGAEGSYAVLTLHRPSNVDHVGVLQGIWGAVSRIANQLPVIFPIHPRTLVKLKEFGFRSDKVIMVDPIGYMDMLWLVKGAALVITDSGGLQEETTALGIPCITIRENTERPVTLQLGTNRLVGTDPEIIIQTAKDILGGSSQVGNMPPLWDGRAAERIVKILIENVMEIIQ